MTQKITLPLGNVKLEVLPDMVRGMRGKQPGLISRLWSRLSRR